MLKEKESLSAKWHGYYLASLASHADSCTFSKAIQNGSTTFAGSWRPFSAGFKTLSLWLKNEFILNP